ncbi:MAG: c-type cytochrome [Chloroflexota bacterium]
MLRQFRQYRFLVMSSFASLITLFSFLGLSSAQPTYATLQATEAATAPAVQGDPVRGQYLVQVAGCAGCHGSPKLATDKGVPLAGGNVFRGPLGSFTARNLTTLQDWTFKEFDQALRQGIEPYTQKVLAPIMPYGVFRNLSDSDVASIGEYLKSLTPVVNDNMAPSKPNDGYKALKPLPAVSIPDLKIDDSAAYGAYLVNAVATCGSCHNPHDKTGAVIKGDELTGGTRSFGPPEQPRVAPSIIGAALTAHGFSEENFAAMMHLGIRPQGVALAGSMPWRRFSHMTDSDLAAMWNYLQTLTIASPLPVQTAPPATQAATSAATTVATQAP